MSYTNMKNQTDFNHSFWSFGKEQEFKPHIKHVDPVLTECDLDWKSHLRWIPEPRYGDAPFPHIKDIKFPSERKLMRSFPQANMMSGSEWSFYPNFGQTTVYHTGKRCFIDSMNHTKRENSLESSIGRKKQVTDKSHTATRARPFLVPEYSPGFHKYGSTLRTPTFGFFDAYKSLIHPHPPSKDFRASYSEKIEAQEKENDILEVKRLSSWKPGRF
nr:spermatogenesis-associated serine-rich protein 1 [Misgurnus anguillicaudatus]